MPDREPPTTHKSAEVEAHGLRLLLDFERRLDEKLGAFRMQFKEDTSSAITMSIQPLKAQIDTVTDRLARGDSAFVSVTGMISEDRRRLDEHSDRIALIAKSGSNGFSTPSAALEKKDAGEDGGYIKVANIPMLLQALGALITTIMATVILIKSPAQKEQTQPDPQQNTAGQKN